MLRASHDNLITLVLLCLILQASSLVLYINELHAAAPPVYERLQPITENLAAPSSIAIGSDERIYVAETSMNRLSVYSPGGNYIQHLKGLDNPYSVAVDGSGMILVGNGRTGNVEVYDGNLNLLTKLGTGDGEFVKPCSITVDGTGKIYVADCGDDKIKVYNSDYSFNFSFGASGNGKGFFNQPSSIAVDETMGEIMVVDTRYASGMMGAYQAPRIQVFDMNGVYKRVFGKRGVDIGKIYRPVGIAIDSQSRIYVSDSYQNVVQVFDNAFTSLGVIYDLANPVMTPLGLAIGNSNRLFVASHNARKVEVYGIDNYTDMTVSPMFLFFQGNEGGANPSSASINIENSGNATFNWNASSGYSWITLSEPSGTLNQGGMSTLNIGVETGGLTVGTYTGTVEVNTDSGTLEVIEVTLTVILSPELSVTPSSLTFDSVNGSIPPSQPLLIENTGHGTLDWTASADSIWISSDKSSGAAPDTVNVSVDPSSMGEGTYAGVISISAAGASGSPAAIPVTLNIISLTGTINVNTNLEGAAFTINGPASYSGSGMNWTEPDSPTGSYTIIYSDVTGYTTPAPQTLLLHDNGSIDFDGQYIRHTGSINVNTNRPDAVFTITGPGSYSGSGTDWSVPDAMTGTYTITFGDVNGYFTPDPQTLTLQKDANITFTGQYDIRYKNVIAGAGYGEINPGLVKVLTHLGLPTGIEFNAHAYMNGVNVASGDVDGDGTDEIITAPGPGSENPAEIRIFDRNGGLMQNLNITAFGHNFGANVASADLDGDGYHEVITGAGAGSKVPADVRIFVYDPGQQNLADSGIDLTAYATSYGVNVAAGDVDGDGIQELITSPGPSNKNLGVLRIWSIDTSSGIGQWSVSLQSEFTVYTEYKYSVTITSGDVNGDGQDEIIAGDGPHSKARDVVRIYDQNGLLLHVWQAGTSFNGYGAHVAAGDLENDGVAEILVSPGPGSDNTSYIKVLDNVGNEKAGFDPLNMPYGANVAVGDLGLEVTQ
jgi:hypothetical protein